LLAFLSEHINLPNQYTLLDCTPLHGHCGKIKNTCRLLMAKQSALLTPGSKALCYITVQLYQLSPAPICSNCKSLKLNKT